MIEFEISAVVASYVSLAFYQNSVPVVSEIKLDNKGESTLSGIELSITCEPAVIAPLIVRVEQIAPGAICYIRAPDLRLDAALLRSMTEGTKAELSITARQCGQDLASSASILQLLPASHWGGFASAPELLAAFVRPNDPAVDVILRETSKRLAAAGKPSAIDGYASGRRDRTWDIVAAMWSGLAAQSLSYVLPPASFEHTGQKVRSPSDVMERRTATCLDTTLLLAACFEQAGLDPLIVLTQGHAFVGVWLQKAELQQALVDDGQVMRKRRDLQELVLVETTLLTHNPPARFSEAVRLGAEQVDEEAAARFELALDVRCARMRQIRPLDLGDGAKAPGSLSPDHVSDDLELDQAPIFIDDIVVAAELDRPDDRLERWKRKLLDLTAKNKLLNIYQRLI